MKKIQIIIYSNTDYKIYSQYISIKKHVKRKLKYDVLTNNNFNLFGELDDIKINNVKDVWYLDVIDKYVLKSKADYILYLDENYTLHSTGIIKYLTDSIIDNVMMGDNSCLFIDVLKYKDETIKNTITPIELNKFVKTYYDDTITPKPTTNVNKLINIKPNTIDIVQSGVETINILVRALGNETHFNRCYASIKQQTNKNVKIIVSYENEKTLKYLKKYQLDSIIKVNHIPNNTIRVNKDRGTTLSINHHFNVMYNVVKDGYVIHLNESNTFTSKNELAILKNKINQDKLLIWKNKINDTITIPTTSDILTEKIVKHRINFNNFMVHKNHLINLTWGLYSISGYEIISKIQNNKTIKTIYFNHNILKI